MNTTFRNYNELVEMVKLDLGLLTLSNEEHAKEVIEAVSRVSNLTAIKTAWVQQNHFLNYVHTSFGKNIYNESLLKVTLKLDGEDEYTNFKMVRVLFTIERFGKAFLEKGDTILFKNSEFRNPKFVTMEIDTYVDCTDDLKQGYRYTVFQNLGTLHIDNGETLVITKLDFSKLGLDTDGDTIEIFKSGNGATVAFNIITQKFANIKVARILKDKL